VVRLASQGTFGGEDGRTVHGNRPARAVRRRGRERGRIGPCDPEPRGPEMRIDLNADVAESFGRWRLGDDAAPLPLLASANVACGFHAGDARTIYDTVVACVDLGVVIGAQVSYRDLAGFGRRPMDVDPADLEADVLYQIAAVDGLARVAG